MLNSFLSIALNIPCQGHIISSMSHFQLLQNRDTIRLLTFRSQHIDKFSTLLEKISQALPIDWYKIEFVTQSH